MAVHRKICNFAVMSIMVKVNGLREAENIHDVEQLEVDLLGFVFIKDSSRYVDMISSRAGIIPDYSLLQRSGEASSQTGTSHRVGVFADEMPQTIVTRVVNERLDYVQLDGSEQPVMIDNLRRTLDPDIRPGIQIIKTFSIGSSDDLARVAAYEGHADLFIFRIVAKEAGQDQPVTSILDGYSGQTPFLLGGTDPDDVDFFSATRHPQFVGVDLDTRFETAPGVIDVSLLSTFIQQLKGGCR